MQDTKEILELIIQRKARVGIIGLGYVGLPLLIEFSKAGFPVLGLDIDSSKIEQLEAGNSYIRHIQGDQVATWIAQNESADATTDFSRASDCDALLICVPTPLTKHRDPDLSFITRTAEAIAPFLRKDQLITLESTTYPGTTEDELIPILEKGSGLKAGEDFFVAYSPEREDPNNADHSTTTIPKVVGGFTPACLEVATALYNGVICNTVPVSSCRTAEATKLMENIFRCINIALVNELKMVFSEMDIDIWEVVEAASTKPFGFMPFYPGPGLGGHCIPIDPFYLTWKAKEYGLPTKFIELAGEINTSMPRYVVQKTLLALNELGKSIKNSRVLIVGLAYKKNVDDARESPTFLLWEALLALGADVDYYDPYCPVVQPSREHPQFAGICSKEWNDIGPAGYDAVIIATAHDNVDHDQLAGMSALVVDTRGACSPADNVVKA
ncbi:MAG: nucleotide sugar dehydrogenase [Kiritimatiellia bacterium]|jgi:UDP-N-acetyl-D-glucosamine dehydrogenase|nr:nucleotide sugar dehydrogenase [Kiritimatiellia bacterium]MDP6848140.1 nucleotide sugar dehydrogenase [Kiritimatiellia bacterium]